MILSFKNVELFIFKVFILINKKPQLLLLQTGDQQLPCPLLFLQLSSATHFNQDFYLYGHHPKENPYALAEQELASQGDITKESIYTIYSRSVKN